MIDPIYHFIFGLDSNFANKPFGYFHYLCLKSCYLTQNKPKIWMHIIHEPNNNIWWEQSKEFFTIVKHDKLPDMCYTCNGLEVYRPEHRADIFRLLLLKEYGGVYADIDTLFYKPFFPHFDKKEMVMGLEGMYHIGWDHWDTHGLCNALIISKKDSVFIDLWLQEYRMSYDNYDWNAFSVRKPYALSQQYKEFIDVEPVHTFHKYNWCGLFYDEVTDQNGFYLNYMSDDGIFSKHMSESKVYDRLASLTDETLKNSTSLFARMCRNIDGLL